MKILVACEESQRVCIAFRNKGHEAYSCDILECSGGHPEWHIKQDVIPLLNGNCIFYTCDGKLHNIKNKWDLIIAHPPCTYMSKAGARWMYLTKGKINQERLQKGIEAKKFFMKFLNADCERIAVENPVSLKIIDLPKPTQIIQPYQFGHPYSKKTCLWLKGLNLLKETKLIKEFTPFLPSNTSQFAKGKGGSHGVAHNSKAASKTFQGIAEAMAEQWGILGDKENEKDKC